MSDNWDQKLLPEILKGVRKVARFGAAVADRELTGSEEDSGLWKSSREVVKLTYFV